MISNAAIREMPDGTIACSWHDDKPTPRSALLTVHHMIFSVETACGRRPVRMDVSGAFAARFHGADVQEFQRASARGWVTSVEVRAAADVPDGCARMHLAAEKTAAA